MIAADLPNVEAAVNALPPGDWTHEKSGGYDFIHLDGRPIFAPAGLRGQPEHFAAVAVILQAARDLVAIASAKQ